MAPDNLSPFWVGLGLKLEGSDSFLLNRLLSLPHEAISLGEFPVTQQWCATEKPYKSTW